ncbi:unnamed protein product [Arabidopsis thaliana]|uniref:Transmembrane protein n=1 Tax=Arabidopsis thaliana TaxID=3702 RepID=A0A654G4D2_ARATH|nr:unnamed protein product [Arabidopsis thaliana]
MSRVLLFLFIFSLSVLVGSINGGSCGSSTPTSEDMYQKQTEFADESARQMGRNGLECEPQGYTGGSGNTNSVGDMILGFFILFFIVGAPIVICLACVRRQQAINAANLNNVSGQVVGAHGTDLKSYPQTGTVQKGDPNYQV